MCKSHNIIRLAGNDECTGCGACVQICPKECIKLIQDRNGFPQPNINVNQCIKCHKCVRTCPVINNEKIINSNTDVYAAMNKSVDTRLQSSSGGVFYAIAKLVINKGGVVFGAKWDVNWNVIHDYSETIEGIGAFMQSKYVQSSIRTTFNQAKNFLDQGRIVLFSGTPCQLGGLRSYLGRSYDNLLQIDFICHGIPSPGVWQKYLNTFSNREEIVNINFRDKKKGWNPTSSYRIEFKDSAVSGTCWDNPFYTGFLHNILIRECCFHCKFRDKTRPTDITLADFWEIDKIMPYFDDKKGTSAILVHSEKGRSLIKALQDEIVIAKQDIDNIIKYNSHVVQGRPVPHRRKYFFLANMVLPFSISKHYIYKDPYFIRIIRRLKRIKHNN